MFQWSLLKLESFSTSVAQQSKVDVFSGICLFVGVFVCQHGNFQTIKHKMMKLGDKVQGALYKSLTQVRI